MQETIFAMNDRIYSRSRRALSIDSRIGIHQLVLQGARLNSEGLPVLAPTLGGDVESELQNLQLSIIQLKLLSLSKQLANLTAT